MRRYRGALILIAGVLASVALGIRPSLCANPAVITVSGTISGSPTAVTVNSIAATISGATFTAVNVPVWPGPNTITAVATDAAGNSSSHVITVYLNSPVTVQGTVTEAVSSVSVNGVAATLSGTNFSASVPLQLGVNTLTVTATDAAGNGTTKTCDIYVARSPIAHP